MKLDIKTGAALAAVAAALAFTASPAAAQSDDHHDHHGWQQRSDDSGQRGRGQEQRAERAAQPQRTYTPQNTYRAQSGQQERAYNAQAQQARQQQQRGWGGQVRQQEQRTYTPQVREQRQSWAGTAQRAERNGTYVDRDRNTTYRSGGWNGDRDGYNRTYRNTQNGSRQWDRSWRNNNRYDWQRYRSINRNVFRGGNYYAPYRGYSYRRLGIGFYLDPLFYGQDYWIGDPGYYRLPDVYGPYRWVRYYDDALLVDIYSGEVVDVIYDFFW